MSTQDTTIAESGGLQTQRRSFREALRAMLRSINPMSGRVVDRPATPPRVAPAVPPETLARLTALQQKLDAALAGEVHDLEALTAEAWTLTPVIASRDASVIIGKVVCLQQRRTAELNRACDFMETMQATNAARRAQDARYVAEVRAQLGKGGNDGHQ